MYENGRVYDQIKDPLFLVDLLNYCYLSNNEIILGVNHCNIPRIIQVIVDCILRDGIDMENLVGKRMVNICKHVQVRYYLHIRL